MEADSLLAIPPRAYQPLDGLGIFARDRELPVPGQRRLEGQRSLERKDHQVIRLLEALRNMRG